MRPRKSNITLIKVLIKVGIGISLGLFVLIVYSDIANKDFSFRLLGLCNFLVSGLFLSFGGLRLFFVPIFLDRINNEEIAKYIEMQSMCGFGNSGEDILAGLILLVVSLIIMTL
ncbi:MAG: hypothetical protein ACFFBQ_21025 [Promethearchaeota archaeon]